jgi:diketogulonate reductase-like aldo/keto reductase
LQQPRRQELHPTETDLTMVTGKSPVYRLNNGIEMPAFGLGVFRSKPEQTVAAVRSAVANGYRLIDTAAAYMNEQQVGEGIRLSGVPREDVFVTTKVWITDYGYDQTLRAFDRSLLKLGLDVLDLYLIHWPVPSAFDATIDAYRAALKLLEEGRVRAIGVCNFSSNHLNRLIEKTGHIPAVNQVELHPFFIQRELREANEKHGIITQAWSPIGGIKRDGEKAKASQEVHDPLSSNSGAARQEIRKDPGADYPALADPVGHVSHPEVRASGTDCREHRYLRLRTCVGGSSGNQRARHRRTWRTRPGAGESANLSYNQS